MCGDVGAGFLEGGASPWRLIGRSPSSFQGLAATINSAIAAAIILASFHHHHRLLGCCHDIASGGCVPDPLPPNPDLGDGFGNCAPNPAAPAGLLGLLGLRRQKLTVRGLAELGDDRPMESGFGIRSRLNAAAGSLTFSPNDSRTVRRVDPVERTDRGEKGGGWRYVLLSFVRDIQPLAEGGTRSSPASSAGFGVLPSAGGPDSSSDMGLTIDRAAADVARVCR